jgi:hypothetical protein
MFQRHFLYPEKRYFCSVERLRRWASAKNNNAALSSYQLLFTADLSNAEIAYKDDAGRYADFHCLRHTTGNLLATIGKLAAFLGARRRKTAYFYGL